MLKNTNQHYGSITKAFHWLFALLLIGMYIVAYTMLNIPRSPFRFQLYDLHKSTGILLFALVWLRLAWRMINVQPALPNEIPNWQHKMSSLNIAGLYLLMICIPIPGFLTSTLGGHPITIYGLTTIAPLANNPVWSDFFGKIHELLGYALIALFSLHVIGSLYHHYWLRDNVLRRMLTD